MKTLFDSSDIIRLFKETDKRIDKLECFFETCCAKVPINVGSGESLYKRLHKNKWEFKSLIAGSNITITDNGSDLTITGTVTPISCQDIDDCLGISALGDPDKYLNEQGDWQTITIPTVGTWGALNYPTWTTGTPFVKMTAAGTFALDTNAYLTSAVTSIATAGLISGGTITGTGTITTSMATNKLVGRSTSGVGVMEEITVGTGLSLSGGTLNTTAQSVGFEMNFLLMGA